MGDRACQQLEMPRPPPRHGVASHAARRRRWPRPGRRVTCHGQAPSQLDVGFGRRLLGPLGPPARRPGGARLPPAYLEEQPLRPGPGHSGPHCPGQAARPLAPSVGVGAAAAARPSGTVCHRRLRVSLALLAVTCQCHWQVGPSQPDPQSRYYKLNPALRGSAAELQTVLARRTPNPKSNFKSKLNLDTQAAKLELKLLLNSELVTTLPELSF
jgi:hypothetical protein